MENLNINVKTNKKRLALNGDENKIIEFNPQDLNTRKKFLKAKNEVFEAQRNFDVKLNNLQEGDIEKALELEQELFEFTKKIVDDIFGIGTTDMITDKDIDVIAVCNFIVAITPYFKEVNEQQKNKYTNNLKSAGLI